VRRALLGIQNHGLEGREGVLDAYSDSKSLPRRLHREIFGLALTLINRKIVYERRFTDYVGVHDAKGAERHVHPHLQWGEGNGARAL